ncbi:hypothetical protein GCM10022223_20870 [Kineosporia mesophila]|uniref:Uncharacterized protein n=1 Tax=Kineosporia mesophila TaxID=566012 RepID=A0ABP6ZHP5_9ACTN
MRGSRAAEVTKTFSALPLPATLALAALAGSVGAVCASLALLLTQLMALPLDLRLSLASIVSIGLASAVGHQIGRTVRISDRRDPPRATR